MKAPETGPEKWALQHMGHENLGAMADGSVVTGSRLVALWLRRVDGYHVTSSWITPKDGLFGGVRYQNVWVLKPCGDSEKNKSVE